MAQLKSTEDLGSDVSLRRETLHEMEHGFAQCEILLDAEGRPANFRTLRVNRAFERLYGLPADQLVGKTILELRPEADRRLIEDFGRVALTGVPAHFQRHIPGVDRWLEVTAYSPAKGQFAVIVTDVTERRNAELKRESILQTALDGFCEVDARGRFVDVNDVYCRMVGYSREELLAMHVMDVEAKEPLDAALRRVERQRETGSARFETLNRHKDGRVFPVEVSTRYVSDWGGRYFSFVRDITERTRAEETLRLRTQELKEAQRLARIGNSLRDVDTNVIVWSDELYRIFGLDAKAGPPNYEKFLSLFSAESRQRIHAAAELLRSEGRGFELELQLAAAGEAARWIIYRAEAERDATGKVVRLRGIVQDITERWLANQALRESEAQYRRIVETMAEGVWTLDPDGRTTFVNPQMATMLGYRPEDLVGVNVLDIIPEEERAPSRERLQRRRRGISEQFETLVPTKDGRMIRLLINARPVWDAEGAYIGSLGVLTNITEKNLLEERLRQAQKMEAIGRLAGGIAHDFNNLLTVINGYGELMLRHAPKADLFQTGLAEIRNAGQRAQELTSQMLSFSRKRMLEPEILSLSEMIGNVEAMLRRLIGEDIELVTRLDPDLSRVRADRTEITQVLLNLAVNARDAMPNGGTLCLETRNLELDGAFMRGHPGLFPGPYVLLAVRDTGIGMDAETQEHLFEPFFTTKEVGKGTGLGLATVYGIVSQSGGWLQVDSTPGQGTIFRIYLPAASGARLARKPEKTVDSSLGGCETILVVEDQPQIRRITALMLRDLGYQVLEASHGAEALRLAAAYTDPIDLVLTDVVMPGMRGPEFAARLQAIRPTRLIFMSGYPESMDAAANDGVGYLQKPFTTEILARKIRTVLGPAVAANESD